MTPSEISKAFGINAIFETKNDIELTEHRDFLIIHRDEDEPEKSEAVVASTNVLATIIIRKYMEEHSQ